MGLDNSTNQIQFSAPEAVVTAKAKGLKPKFACHGLPLYVNVRRLIAVEAREEETIRSGDISDFWHSGQSRPPHQFY